MPITLNTTLKNTLLDGIDAVFNSGTCVLYGAAPTGAGNAAPASVLATITLNADSFVAASAGSKAKNGTWSATATGTGTAQSFRLINSGATQVLEGTVTVTGGGGDITLDNTSINSGQTVTIATFSLTS
jgi:hypothetical protein